MLTRSQRIRDGLIVGLIGYAAVALFYSTFDVVAARSPLHTVNVLGRAVFRGLRDPALLVLPSAPDLGAIFAYNVVHLVSALAIGLVVVWLVSAAEEQPQWRPLVRFIIVAGYFVTVLAVAFMTVPMRAVVPLWSIVVANAAATLLAAYYLIRTHPGLFQRLALTQS